MSLHHHHHQKSSKPLPTSATFTPTNNTFDKKTMRKRPLGWILHTKRNVAILTKEEEDTLGKLDTIPYRQLKRILVKKGLIKETSKAPADVLRQIARGIII